MTTGGAVGGTQPDGAGEAGPAVAAAERPASALDEGGAITRAGYPAAATRAARRWHSGHAANVHQIAHAMCRLGMAASGSEMRSIMGVRNDQSPPTVARVSRAPMSASMRGGAVG